MYELIEDLVESGIDVTLTLDKRGDMCANLNPETKSGMYLHPTGYVTGRYGEEEFVSSVEDLCYIFLNRYRMRDFGSQKWLELCVSKGLLEKRVKTTVEYLQGKHNGISKI